MRNLIVTENEIQNVPEVPFTETWRPIHHRDIIEFLGRLLQDTGVGIRNKSYNMSENGWDLFATWTLDMSSVGGRAHQMLGFRNSMQKHFALGLCAGQIITVCENMCFSGDFVEHRRHTSGLTVERLLEFLQRALGIVREHGRLFEMFFEALARHTLPENSRKVLTFDAMERGIVPPSKFNQLQLAWEEESKLNPEGDPNLQQFHNSITRILRESSVGQIQTRTGELNTMLGWKDILESA